MHWLGAVASLGGGGGEMQDHIRQMTYSVGKGIRDRAAGGKLRCAMVAGGRGNTGDDRKRLRGEAGPRHNQIEFAGKCKRKRAHREHRAVQEQTTHPVLASNGSYRPDQQDHHHRPLFARKLGAACAPLKCGDRDERAWQRSIQRIEAAGSSNNGRRRAWRPSGTVGRQSFESPERALFGQHHPSGSKGAIRAVMPNEANASAARPAGPQRR